MAPPQTRILRALVVYINSMYKEMFRAVRVYRITGGSEETEEKEYLLGNRKDKSFGENGGSRVLTLYGFDVSEQRAGVNNGVWKCVYVFDSLRTQSPLVDFCDEWIPISQNCRLVFHDLVNDLHTISKLARSAETTDSEQSLLTEACSSKNFSKHPMEMTTSVRFLDLNSIPDSDADENNGISEPKKRRAAPEDIARIALEDLAKYFDLPITEASKSLKVGLTVLKKKCREFGIPRWPHRKIKSLDRLISNLQEEMQQQREEDEATAMAVSKKKRMIEFEKKRIEKKPSMDIREETKKFRQDVFKRKHKARILERESQNRNNATLSLS
ncbi:PREDICTED: protein RKD5-like [Ipomoea nil]|uniref:protein RKD5-like n=1 Tax=Ipomoea nil TaxID=35883 RepID=UPI000901A8D6|nr:PREDICTED: protein RKD5-like [Ipomoea nil]XP_019182535.1 PREDICTED: protein RKD5-like [Ipomoea nil]